jgi:hypothetical protein
MKYGVIEPDLVRAKHREKREVILAYSRYCEHGVQEFYYVCKSDENLPELYQIVDEFYMDRDGRCYIVFDDYNGRLKSINEDNL